MSGQVTRLLATCIGALLLSVSIGVRFGAVTGFAVFFRILFPKKE